MKITLSPRELAMCDMIASMRYWQGCGTDTTIIDKRKGKQDLDLRQNMHSASNSICTWTSSAILEKDSFDFISKDGATIDIKATDRMDGNLVVPKLMHDVYVLAIVDGNTVDLVGYATKEMILKKQARKTLAMVLFGLLTGKNLKTW